MPDRSLLWLGVGLGLVLIIGAAWAGKKAVAAVGDVAQAVNPLNPDNVFAGAVNATGAAVSGNPDFSLGAWLWELTHPGQAARDAAITAPVTLDKPGGASGSW